MIFCLTDLASIIHDVREFTQTRVLSFIQEIKKCFQKKYVSQTMDTITAKIVTIPIDFINPRSKQVTWNQEVY